MAMKPQQTALTLTAAWFGPTVISPARRVVPVSHPLSMRPHRTEAPEQGRSALTWTHGLAMLCRYVREQWFGRRPLATETSRGIFGARHVSAKSSDGQRTQGPPRGSGERAREQEIWSSTAVMCDVQTGVYGRSRVGVGADGRIRPPRLRPRAMCDGGKVCGLDEHASHPDACIQADSLTLSVCVWSWGPAG